MQNECGDEEAERRCGMIVRRRVWRWWWQLSRSHAAQVNESTTKTDEAMQNKFDALQVCCCPRNRIASGMTRVHRRPSWLLFLRQRSASTAHTSPTRRNAPVWPGKRWTTTMKL
jgi:hypothetical protein